MTYQEVVRGRKPTALLWQKKSCDTVFSDGLEILAIREWLLIRNSSDFHLTARIWYRASFGLCTAITRCGYASPPQA